MKSKKLLKSASLIALSAVMMCGAAITFAGCEDSAFTIKISMFCNDSDIVVNQTNCDNWAAQYTQKLLQDGTFQEGEAIKIEFSYQTNTENYFTDLLKSVASNSQPDVFYVSPKYVKAWSTANKILDLSDALAADAANVTGERGIWEDSLAFYGYSKDDGYTSGDRIRYDEASKKFVTVKNGTPVGIYGLPKDYSNFGLGFNNIFFSDKVRTALTSTTTADRTGVSGAEYEGKKLSYGGENGVVTFDEGGSDDANLVNIGVPTYYRPYNFYKYASFSAALQGGDPMANAVQLFTGGKGYCVTIPGWPGDTFADAKKWGTEENNPWKDVEDTKVPVKDENAVYDTEQGYITYTYAEFSALTWVVTYYCNTYDWQGNGTGGVMTDDGVKNVYGNDQYDGVLYLLPWLAGNDAQYLNEDSTTALNGTDYKTVGTATYDMNRMRLNGETEAVPTQYGVNSERFLETAGAFQSYGFDWNGNSNNAGDTAGTKSSGWNLFVAGNCVFYGVGTWNSGPLNATDRKFLEYRLMPEPVSEHYALASYVKTEDYVMKGYVWDQDAWDNNGTTAKVTENAFTGYEDAYDGQAIMDNQIARQDKWGARMDSVGYGVSALITNGAAWRKDAAIDLVKYLTIDPSTQVTLTYAGSQLPNFKYQCKDFYIGDGEFDDMITPEDPEWADAYKLAQDMTAAGQNRNTRSTLIKDYLADKTVNGQPVNFDAQYGNDPLSSLANLSYAMKVLYLVSYTKADRDLSLRMQYGLNAVRDSAMYTYDDAWLDLLDARGQNAVLAYNLQTSYSNIGDILRGLLKGSNPDDIDKTAIKNSRMGTPMWWTLHQAKAVEEKLQDIIAQEKNLVNGK